MINIIERAKNLHKLERERVQLGCEITRALPESVTACCHAHYAEPAISLWIPSVNNPENDGILYFIESGKYTASTKDEEEAEFLVAAIESILHV